MPEPTDNERLAELDLLAARTPYLADGWLCLVDQFGWSLREAQVAQLLSAGLEEKLMASALNISMSTVHSHIQSLYEKTRAHGRARFLNKLAHRCPLQFHADVDVPSPYPPPPNLNFCTSTV